jgi:hypothetical protein
MYKVKALDTSLIIPEIGIKAALDKANSLTVGYLQPEFELYKSYLKSVDDP